MYKYRMPRPACLSRRAKAWRERFQDSVPDAARMMTIISLVSGRPALFYFYAEDFNLFGDELNARGINV